MRQSRNILNFTALALVLAWAGPATADDPHNNSSGGHSSPPVQVHAPPVSAPHYQPPAPHYEPPAPHYQAPAPHYEAPAPHYAAPTPHAQDPQVRFNDVPQPGPSRFNGSANGSSAEITADTEEPTRLHVSPSTSHVPVVVVRNGIMQYNSTHTSIGWMNATPPQPQAPSIQHLFNGFPHSAPPSHTVAVVSPFVAPPTVVVPYQQPYCYDFYNPYYAYSNRYFNPYYSPYGYAGIGSDSSEYYDGSGMGYDPTSPDIGAPSIPAAPAQTEVQSWTISGQIQSITDQTVHVLAPNGLYNFVLTSGTAVNKVVSVGDTVQVTFSMGADGSYQALKIIRP